MNLPSDPVPEITKLAEEIVRPGHGLFEDLVQEGYVAFFDARSQNVPIPEAMEAATDAMHDFLKKERRFQRGLVPLRETDDIGEQ